MRVACEVAIGFQHGQWIQEEVEVDVIDEGDGDLEGAIREAAEEAALVRHDHKEVAFAHMLHWTAVTFV